MIVVHVDVAVLPDRISDFLAATVTNAASSLTEPGVLRFDVVQDLGDPAHVVLVEVYRNQDAVDAHKRTAHYATWRDAVVELMARPRTSVKYRPVAPTAEAGWTART